jgi:Aminoglycoside-2''-adenylyltransferase
MSELELENWDPLTPREVAELLKGADAHWWIAGGLAIDAFVGSFDRRSHEDVDVGLLARDQEVVRAALAGWELFCADPPGTLRPWLDGEHLEEPVHDVWGRQAPGEPWRLALVLNPSDGETWAYRRDDQITRPVTGITFERDGIRYLAPEIQLLYKSKGLRPKDERDFDDAEPLLDADQRAWLRRALELTSPGHHWLPRLRNRPKRP